MSVKLIITFQVKEERLEAFLQLLQEVKVALPKVDGCQGIQLFQSSEHKQTITLLESWQSVEKHKSHIEKVISSGDWEKIASHLSDEPVSDYLHEL
jgi:quinol monooxygenase YgiN